MSVVPEGDQFGQNVGQATQEGADHDGEDDPKRVFSFNITGPA